MAKKRKKEETNILVTAFSNTNWITNIHSFNSSDLYPPKFCWWYNCQEGKEKSWSPDSCVLYVSFPWRTTNIYAISTLSLFLETNANWRIWSASQKKAVPELSFIWCWEEESIISVFFFLIRQPVFLFFHFNSGSGKRVSFSEKSRAEYGI